jgi:hypothetical protein
MEIALHTIPHCTALSLRTWFRECTKTSVEGNKVHSQYLTEIPSGCASI